MHIEGFK